MLGITTQVNRRPEILIQTLNVGGNIGLQFYNKKVYFPDFMKESIDFVLQETQFTVQGIPGEIDDESKIVFVTKLVEEGLLGIDSGGTDHSLLRPMEAIPAAENTQ